MIREKGADWENVAEFPDFVIVRRKRHFSSDRYAVIAYKTVSSFENAPPFWDETISKEDAEKYRRDLDAMYAFYQALSTEEDARRREARARAEQYEREHPELFSKKPLSKRQKRKLKKRLQNQHPHSTGYDRFLNSQQKGQES